MTTNACLRKESDIKFYCEWESLSVYGHLESTSRSARKCSLFFFFRVLLK